MQWPKARRRKMRKGRLGVGSDPKVATKLLE